jgi:hypothetical protein
MLALCKPEAHRVSSALRKALIVIRGALRISIAFYTYRAGSMSSDEVGSLVKSLRRRGPDVCLVKVE